jgi:hypothetical protein
MMKKRGLSSKGYSLDPINISDDLWLYEDGKGIEVYYKIPGQVAYKIVLPWRKLDATLDRRRKILGKRRKRP